MFAEFYDWINADIDYDEMLKPIVTYLNRDMHILDAGCGSGHILSYLSQKGFRLTGIDIDDEMLALANKKDLSDKVDLYQHDLRKPLYQVYDAILMLFDVVNYFKGINQVFKNVYQSLKKGGIFILDFYKEEYLIEMKDYQESDDKDGWQYQWLVKTTQTQLQHHLTVNENDYQFIQYIYPLKYYIIQLESIGFDVKQIDGIDERKYYLICHK